MKTFNLHNRGIVLLGIFCFCLCACTNTPKDKTEELKVLAWNVWHGGHSKNYPAIGCENVIGILKKSNADVILMV